MKTFLVKEYEEVEMVDFQLTDFDRDYLTNLSSLSNSPMFQFYELKDRVKFKFSSWVGVLELENARIVIQPKFNQGFQHVVDMLLFTEGLPLTREHETRTAYQNNSLMELLVRLYLKETDILLRQGIRKEYINIDEDLSVLRGRINIREQINKNPFSATKLYCNYDELDTNIVDNQVIQSALEIASKLKLEKGTAKKLNRVKSEFQVITDSYQLSYWPNFSYNRLNKHYEKAHKLAYYIWQQNYINNVYQFNSKSHFSFLLDMNEVFEAFITKFLQVYISADWKVTGQQVYKKSMMKNGSSYHDIKPDIIIRNADDEFMVMDTKYKPYGQKKISNEDIYQLHFYAQFLNSTNPSSTILFPQYEGEGKVEEVINILPGIVDGKLHVKSVNTEKILYSIRDENIKNLREEVRRIIGEE